MDTLHRGSGVSALHHSSFHSGTFTFGCTSETVSPMESHPKQDLKHQSAEVPTILPFDSHLVGVKCPFMIRLSSEGFLLYTWEIRHVG